MLILLHFTNVGIERQKHRQLAQGHRAGEGEEVNLESVALEVDPQPPHQIPFSVCNKNQHGGHSLKSDMETELIQEKVTGGNRF